MEEAWEFAVVSDDEQQSNDEQTVSGPSEDSDRHDDMDFVRKGAFTFSIFFSIAILIPISVTLLTFLGDSVIIQRFLEQLGALLDDERFSAVAQFLSGVGLSVAVYAGFLNLTQTRRVSSQNDDTLKQEDKTWREKLLSRREKRRPSSRVFKNNFFSSGLFGGTVTEDWRDFLLTTRNRYLFESEEFGRLSLVYLSVGILISAVAIVIVFVLAIGNISILPGQTDFQAFLPRLAFAILIQSLGYFFLRRHVAYERQRQHCSYMLAQIEMKLGAGAFASSPEAKSLVASALATEALNTGHHNNSNSSAETPVLLALLGAFGGKKNG